MCATTEVTPLHNDDEVGDLSDQQIDQLLARASARLKSKPPAESRDLLKLDDDVPAYNLPKLQTGQLEKSYVSQAKGRATLDSKRLVDNKDRDQANIVRKVQNPAAVKLAAIEVSLPLDTLSTFSMRKFNPKFSRAEFGRRLGLPFCHMRVLLQIIVTLSQQTVFTLSNVEP